MTGYWEGRLRAMAEGGQAWGVQAREQLLNRLEALEEAVIKAESDPGIDGVAGERARQAFEHARNSIREQISHFESIVPGRVSDANAQREAARNALAGLSAGELSSGQEALVRGAATGTTIMLGPLSLLAGQGAVSAFNSYLGAARESEAKEKFEAIESSMRSLTFDPPPRVESFEGGPVGPIDPPDPEPVRQPTGGGNPSSTRPPQYDVDPIGTVRDDPSFAELLPPKPPVGTVLPDPVDVIDLTPVPDIGTLPDTEFPSLPDEHYIPTPDGPTDGVTTLPGNLPSPSYGGGLGGGSSVGGVGSGLGVGLAAGAGGAAALGRVARLGGLGGGALGGAAGAPGAGRGGAAAGRGGLSGGLLGKGAPAGGAGGAGALGARGGMVGGGMGAGGAAGGGTGTGTRGAGGAGTGTRGAGGMGGVGAAGGGAAGGASGARGAGGRGGLGAGSGMMGGAPGGRGDRKNERGRGMGGPIAERMEDDEEFGPRSENAGAGGRDDS